MRKPGGFSLIELLVVVAIVAVIVAFLVPALSRAMSKARQTAADEAKRQKNLVPYRNHTNFGRDGDESALRKRAREAFRQTIDAGKFETVVTETTFIVRNDDEFRAYWYTLIGETEDSQPLDLGGDGVLAARDDAGDVFYLPRSAGEIEPGHTREKYPLAWDFLSTNMSDMSLGNLGITVLYNDGTREYIRYPGPFPATRLVAELSQRFITAFR